MCVCVCGGGGVHTSNFEFISLYAKDLFALYSNFYDISDLYSV